MGRKYNAYGIYKKNKQGGKTVVRFTNTKRQAKLHLTILKAKDKLKGKSCIYRIEKMQVIELPRTRKRRKKFDARKHVLDHVKMEATLTLGQTVVGAIPESSVSPTIHSSMSMLSLVQPIHASKGVLKSIEDLGK